MASQGREHADSGQNDTMTDGAQQTNWKPIVLGLSSIEGGFALSFLGFGLLWIGTPWAYQFLMVLPFFALSFAVTRIRTVGNQACLLIVCGASPLGMVIPMFRDNNDSYVMSGLIVCGWAAGIAAGYYLGKEGKQGIVA